jgi:hypothetical protein
VAATKTLQDAQAIARMALRDDSTDQYETYLIRAINFVLQFATNKAQNLRQAGDAAVISGVNVIDLPALLVAGDTTLTDVASYRITRLWIGDHDTMRIVDMDSIRRSRGGTTTAQPKLLAFETETRGLFDTTTDQAYTLRVSYWRPHPWLAAPGDSILIHDEFLYQLMVTGVPEVLRSAEQKRPFTATGEFMNTVMQMMDAEPEEFMDLDVGQYE